MPTPVERSPWYTPAESGRYLRCSERTIYRMIEQGVLPAHRAGTRIVRIHRDDLDAALGRVPA